MKKGDKMFIVRKYIMAESVASAIKKEKKVKPHDVFIDDEWRKNRQDSLASAIGFTI